MNLRGHGRAVPLLVASLLIAACGDSGSTIGRIGDDGPGPGGGNGEIVDALLRGPGAARFAIDPVFANGPDTDALATYWGCDVGGLNTPVRLRFGFAEDGDGTTFGPGAGAQDEAFRWRSEGNTVALKKRSPDPYRIDLADISFVDDVRFGAAFYFSSAEDFDLDDRFDTSTPSSLSVDCTLVDATDDTPLARAPHMTSEGAASWPRPDPEPLERVPTIAAMYTVGRLTNVPGGPIYGYSTRIAFDDGTFTRAVDEVAEIGVAASRVQSPDDWGEWRGGGSGTEFRYGDGSFSGESLLWAYAAQPSDTVLDECYGSSGSASVGGLDGTLTVLNVSRFCFGANGVFTHGSTTTTTSPVLVAASGRDDAGTYRISGFLLELDYGDGRRARKLFGGDATTVAVGDGAFLQGL